MSSITWTPAALSSKAGLLQGACWRVVEAQHVVSTLKLVDSIEEQRALEDLVEASKPAIPEECRHLSYLLSTPFRYGAPYPEGSRFRRAGLTAGVFHSAEAESTAVAEIAFYRLLFYAESPRTPWPSNPAQFTAFSADLASGKCIDLSARPFARHAARWSHATDYSFCQSFANVARSAAVEIVRYRSVRDPQAGMNLAILGLRRLRQAEADSQPHVVDSPAIERRAGGPRVSQAEPVLWSRRLCQRFAHRGVAVGSMTMKTEGSGHEPQFESAPLLNTVRGCERAGPAN